MAGTYTHQFDTAVYKGSSTIHTRLFINGKWVDPVKGGSIEVVNPATGQVITSVSAGTKEDVDIAVEAAKKAYKTSWGLRVPGYTRGRLLSKLADLLEENAAEFGALEALDVGKVYIRAKLGDIASTVKVLRYYAGWADKVQGKTIETRETKLAYTRHEPYGVVVSAHLFQFFFLKEVIYRDKLFPGTSPWVCLDGKSGPPLQPETQ